MFDDVKYCLSYIFELDHLNYKSPRTYIESRLSSKLPEHLSEFLGYNRSIW